MGREKEKEAELAALSMLPMISVNVHEQPHEIDMSYVHTAGDKTEEGFSSLAQLQG